MTVKSTKMSVEIANLARDALAIQVLHKHVEKACAKRGFKLVVLMPSGETASTRSHRAKKYVTAKTTIAMEMSMGSLNPVTQAPLTPKGLVLVVQVFKLVASVNGRCAQVKSSHKQRHVTKSTTTVTEKSTRYVQAVPPKRRESAISHQRAVLSAQMESTPV